MQELRAVARYLFLKWVISLAQHEDSSRTGQETW